MPSLSSSPCSHRLHDEQKLSSSHCWPLYVTRSLELASKNAHQPRLPPFSFPLCSRMASGVLCAQQGRLPVPGVPWALGTSTLDECTRACAEQDLRWGN